MGTCNLFRVHDRAWQNNKYVYPVISRRSGGLSIGINLNPDKACNFDCVYCSVDRTIPPLIRDVDLSVLRAELEQMLEMVLSGELFDAAPFAQAPRQLRRLNDVAFSGDGEPTAFPRFHEACEVIAQVPANRNLTSSCKIVLITNATLLHRREVAQALEVLDHSNGEIWAKLDAGTDAYYRAIARTSVPLNHVLRNILNAGRRRVIVIQSLFVNLDGQPPAAAEITAWLARLRELRDEGCRIKLVQVYTVARRPTECYVSGASDALLDNIACRVRELGISAQPFYGTE
jgi:wyosine [tRNA(Phe)-imidazoG37] synthetase (radical SAM superfamily)